MRILLVDDDTELTELLARFLTQEGFEVVTAPDGARGLEAARSGRFDLMVLDVMMPDQSGMDVLRALRAFSDLPVIMLTARGDEMDRIIGLELGADDYLPKPCNPRELAARIRAVLRRTRHAPSASANRPRLIGTLEWHPASRRVLEQGREIPLTSTEYEILAYLMAHAGEVVRKEDLSREALGKRLGPFDRALDVHISR
ncbi:MAG: DNA-binding response regulator, partial [Zetaproteobacteria bacterium]